MVSVRCGWFLFEPFLNSRCLLYSHALHTLSAPLSSLSLSSPLSQVFNPDLHDLDDGWAIIDCGLVVVHLFEDSKNTRTKADLERRWSREGHYDDEEAERREEEGRRRKRGEGGR